MESQKKEMLSRLTELIDNKRDDLISLTQDLVRIPTLNPPGENYLKILLRQDKHREVLIRGVSYEAE